MQHSNTWSCRKHMDIRSKNSAEVIEDTSWKYLWYPKTIPAVCPSTEIYQEQCYKSCCCSFLSKTTWFFKQVTISLKLKTLFLLPNSYYSKGAFFCNAEQPPRLPLPFSPQAVQSGPWGKAHSTDSCSLHLLIGNISVASLCGEDVDRTFAAPTRHNYFLSYLAMNKLSWAKVWLFNRNCWSIHYCFSIRY